MQCPSCGLEVAGAPACCPSCGAGMIRKEGVSPMELTGVSPKSRLAATLLAFFLGEFGAHRFYTGKIGTAVVMLVLAIIGIATVWFLVGIAFLVAVGIWALVDFIFAVSGNMKDSAGRPIKNW